MASESDVCLRAKCPHFEECFYQRARRDAATADVLVVNHHLLFSDLAVRRAQGNYTAPAVLPHYRRLILDEAHNLEEAATRHLGATVSRRGLFRVLRRLENRGKGVLPSLHSALEAGRGDLLAQAALDLLADRLIPALEGARERAGRVFGLLEELLRGQRTRCSAWRRTSPPTRWEPGVGGGALRPAEAPRHAAEGNRLLRERISVDEEARKALEAQLLELRGAANRLKASSSPCAATLRPGEDALRMVRWMEMRRDPRGGEPNLTLSAAPLDLSGVLREALLERIPTVVLTSATLATRRDFRFLRERLGSAEDDPVNEAIFPSPFDYERQALLVVPSDFPVPPGEADRRHDEATVAQRWSSRRSATAACSSSSPPIGRCARWRRGCGGAADRSRPLFVHGEAPRAQLVQRFVESGRGILLGTTSFWEGVDVPGRPLRGLVIPKLPFKVPLRAGHGGADRGHRGAGGNSFTRTCSPRRDPAEAGLRAAIRSRSDHGAVLILDGRIVRKSYGALPSGVAPAGAPGVGRWREVIHAELVEFYGAGSDGRGSLRDVRAGPGLDADSRGAAPVFLHLLVHSTPIPLPASPSKIVCVGRNYLEHARELGNEVPERPLIFLKPPSSLVGAGRPLCCRRQSEQVEHEGEIAVVIGKRPRSVPAARALEYVAGFAPLNDVTARDLQRTDGQWTRAKGFDTFCPIGTMTPADGVDPSPLEVICRVNGEVRQHGRASDMAFSIPVLIEYITSVMTLEPGDVIATGTPAGRRSAPRRGTWWRWRSRESERFATQ